MIQSISAQFWIQCGLTNSTRITFFLAEIQVNDLMSIQHVTRGIGYPKIYELC
jgi:hypothetical protein